MKFTRAIGENGGGGSAGGGSSSGGYEFAGYTTQAMYETGGDLSGPSGKIPYTADPNKGGPGRQPGSGAGNVTKARGESGGGSKEPVNTTTAMIPSEMGGGRNQPTFGGNIPSKPPKVGGHGVALPPIKERPGKPSITTKAMNESGGGNKRPPGDRKSQSFKDKYTKDVKNSSSKEELKEKREAKRQKRKEDRQARQDYRKKTQIGRKERRAELKQKGIKGKERMEAMRDYNQTRKKGRPF